MMRSVLHQCATFCHVWAFRMTWRQKKEKFWSWLSRRMPRVLVYHCTIRVGVHGTTGKHETTVVPDVTYMEILKRWDQP